MIANSISTVDERSLHMGNVPLVRLGHDATDAGRIDIVVGEVVEEVLKDYLWRCQTHEIRELPFPFEQSLYLARLN